MPVAGLMSSTSTAGAIGARLRCEVGSVRKASWAAGPAVMSNAELVAPVGPVADADSVYPDPVLSMLRFPNVATPPTALTVVVPESVPPPGFAPIAIVTGSVAVGSRTPNSSRIDTSISGAIAVPAVAVVRPTVKES